MHSSSFQEIENEKIPLVKIEKSRLSGNEEDQVKSSFQLLWFFFAVCVEPSNQCFSTFFASRTTLCNKKILGNTKLNFIITIMMFSSVLALLIY